MFDTVILIFTISFISVIVLNMVATFITFILNTIYPNS